MIQTEMVGDRIRHYSDAGMKIRQVETGIIYGDAVDVMPCRYTYEETNEPIPETPIGAEEALEILMGGYDDNTDVAAGHEIPQGHYRRGAKPDR